MHRNVQLSSPLPRRPNVRAGRSVVAVIGIDQYIAWPRLSNAVSDARSAARLFMQLGFVEVTEPLLDGAATSEAMHRLVTTDLAHLASDDSLVLFFAGHGHTCTTHFDDVSVKTGYVIPADAALPGEHVAATWLRLDSWLSDIARLPPRHILVMIDACHSGVALSCLHKWRDEAGRSPRDLHALQTRRSRRIITSALDDQRAMDGGPYPGHSLFTGCLLEALSGGLGEDGQHVATGTELGQYIQKRVSSYPHTTQTPDFGAFELDGRGDIVVPILVQEATSGEPESKLPGPAPLIATPLAHRSSRNPTRPRSTRVRAVAVAMAIISGGVTIGAYKLCIDTSDVTKTIRSKDDAGVVAVTPPDGMPAVATPDALQPDVINTQIKTESQKTNGQHLQQPSRSKDDANLPESDIPSIDDRGN